MENDYSSQSYNRNSKLNSFLLKISAAIILVFIFFITINYLDIVNFKNFQNQPTPTPSPTSLDQKIKTSLPFLSCPFSQELCKTGKLISTPSGKFNTNYSIQFNNIPPKATLSAAISGNITYSNSNIINIDNPKRGVKVTYSIKTSQLTIQKDLKTVAENQPIATLGTGPNSLNLSATATISNLSIHLNIEPQGKFLVSLD